MTNKLRSLEEIYIEESMRFNRDELLLAVRRAYYKDFGRDGDTQKFQPLLAQLPERPYTTAGIELARDVLIDTILAGRQQEDGLFAEILLSTVYKEQSENADQAMRKVVEDVEALTEKRSQLQIIRAYQIAENMIAENIQATAAPRGQK